MCACVRSYERLKKRAAFKEFRYVTIEHNINWLELKETVKSCDRNVQNVYCSSITVKWLKQQHIRCSQANTPK